MTKFSVTYNRNGATSGATPVDPGSPYFINSSVTVLGQGSLGRIDHVFKGWAVTPDAAVPQYLPDSTFTITENTLLYAVWEATSFETEGVMDSNQSKTDFTWLKIASYNPAHSTQNSALSQTFVGDGRAVAELSLFLQAVGPMSAGSNPRFEAEIYSAIGAVGSVLPDESGLLGVSDQLYFNDLPTEGGWVKFSFASPIPTVNGVTYVLVVRALSGGLSGGNVPPYVQFAVNSNDVYMGNAANFFDSLWHLQSSGVNLLFIVYGTTLKYMVSYFANWPGGVVGSGSAPVDSNGYEQYDIVTVKGNTGNMLKTGYVFKG